LLSGTHFCKQIHAKTSRFSFWHCHQLSVEYVSVKLNMLY
jgi:hypothetical protein